MNLKSIMIPALLLLAALGMASCDDNLVYEKEGDCTPKVQFVFKKHRQALHSQPGREADVFYATVGTVHLFVFDEESGELVYEQFENTENLKSASDLNIGSQTEKCYMPVDLNPGRYRFIAWCGLENNEDHFTLQKNVSRPEHLTCTMTRSVDSEDNTVYCDKNLKPLFHGRLSHKFPDKQGDHYATVYLTKNTNYIQLALHHNAGELESDRFSVTMEDTNGYLAHDNSLLSDDLIQYRPWSQRGGVVDMDMLNYSTKAAEEGTGFLVAELATSRLMADNDPRLTVTDKQTGQAVFSLPLVKYLLMMKSDRYAAMDGQEYLDREDEYSVIVFLENSKNNEGWLAAQIVINGWHIVNNGNVGL